MSISDIQRPRKAKSSRGAYAAAKTKTDVSDILPLAALQRPGPVDDGRRWALGATLLMTGGGALLIWTAVACAIAVVR